jgi:hypothetical protein
MNDTLRKKLAATVLALSLAAGTAVVATSTSFESAWTGGNSQPPSGLLLGDKERFTALLAGSNETHTGTLTSLPR